MKTLVIFNHGWLRSSILALLLLVSLLLFIGEYAHRTMVLAGSVSEQENLCKKSSLKGMNKVVEFEKLAERIFAKVASKEMNSQSINQCLKSKQGLEDLQSLSALIAMGKQFGVCNRQFQEKFVEVHNSIITKSQGKGRLINFFKTYGMQVQLTCKRNIVRKLMEANNDELARRYLDSILVIFKLKLPIESHSNDDNNVSNCPINNRLPEDSAKVQECRQEMKEQEEMIEEFSRALDIFENIENLVLMDSRDIPNARGPIMVNDDDDEPIVSVSMPMNEMAIKRVEKLQEGCLYLERYFLNSLYPIAHYSGLRYRYPDSELDKQLAHSTSVHKWLAVAQLCQGIMLIDAKPDDCSIEDPSTPIKTKKVEFVIMKETENIASTKRKLRALLKNQKPFEFSMLTEERFDDIEDECANKIPNRITTSFFENLNNIKRKYLEKRFKESHLSKNYMSGFLEFVGDSGETSIFPDENRVELGGGALNQANYNAASKISLVSLGKTAKGSAAKGATVTKSHPIPTGKTIGQHGHGVANGVHPYYYHDPYYYGGDPYYDPSNGYYGGDHYSNYVSHGGGHGPETALVIGLSVGACVFCVCLMFCCCKYCN